MRNDEIAAAFEELADRLALTDEKPYRYLAYRRAATTFRELADSAAVLSGEGRLRDVPGIGPAIDEKVRELLASGTFPALERARADVDDVLLELVSLPGIGPATARKAHAALGSASFAELLDRARAGELATGSGVSAKLVSALSAEAARRASGPDRSARGLSGVPRDASGVPLDGPWLRRDQAQQLALDTIAMLGELVTRASISGAYARGCELVRDVRIAASASDPHASRAAVCERLASRGWDVAAHEPAAVIASELAPLGAAVCAASLVSASGITVIVAITREAERALLDSRLAGPASWPADAPDSVAVELRDRVLAGELSMASAASFDELVRAEDLRGELHAHSDWSDGRATILEMAHAARARGDAYFAVTDHSSPYAMVGGLDPARLAAQADEIARVNEQLALEHERDGAPAFTVLRGTELEILPDGSLGLDDAALGTLDWVVASLHAQQGQSEHVIRERMRAALENPLVDAIGHPTSRRLLVRERTAIDVCWLIEQAIEHDVVLEINANPDRLDLDSTHAAQAVAAGARLTINTDAHRTATLSLREHGIAVARRAAVPRRCVVNALSLSELRAARRSQR